MKILVTGASSFVGAWFCTAAVAAGHEVWGTWRKTPLRVPGVRHLVGDLPTLRPPEVDVVVHLATKVMADDAHAQNTRMMSAVLGWGHPVVYASSTVVHWERENAYQRSRREDEARLRARGLPWIIVRPCAPYGPLHPQHRPAHKESFHTLVRLCRFPGFVPVLGDGQYRRQPVHVGDFSAAILGLVAKKRWGGAYDAGGPTPMPFVEVVRTLGGRPLFLPRGLVKAGGRLAGFHEDVLATFDSDDVVDAGPLAEASGVQPRPFSEGVKELLGGLR